MKKYRYFMNGMFSATDGEEYEINIPSPFIQESESEAMKDGELAYRFTYDPGINEPVIVIFERENFEAIQENGRKALKVWVENAFKRYSYEEFKELKGYIRMLKPECKGRGYIDGNTDFLDTDKTFADIFPNMDKQKLYYIDNEAYYIDTVGIS